MGFRLKERKHLSVIGDLGHFSGAGLHGGYLEVTGSTGSWCGADMMSGRIKVAGDAHSKTGEQMKGGQIQVNGRIQEIAKYRSGGDIRSKYDENRHPTNFLCHIISMQNLDDILKHIWPKVRERHFYPEVPAPQMSEGKDRVGLEMKGKKISLSSGFVTDMAQRLIPNSL